MITGDVPGVAAAAVSAESDFILAGQDVAHVIRSERFNESSSDGTRGAAM